MHIHIYAHTQERRKKSKLDKQLPPLSLLPLRSSLLQTTEEKKKKSPKWNNEERYSLFPLSIGYCKVSPTDEQQSELNIRIWKKRCLWVFFLSRALTVLLFWFCPFAFCLQCVHLPIYQIQLSVSIWFLILSLPLSAFFGSERKSTRDQSSHLCPCVFGVFVCCFGSRLCLV